MKASRKREEEGEKEDTYGGGREKEDTQIKIST
jgi:hypothetical protein